MTGGSHHYLYFYRILKRPFVNRELFTITEKGTEVGEGRVKIFVYTGF